jgi:hypothetical protein
MERMVWEGVSGKGWSRKGCPWEGVVWEGMVREGMVQEGMSLGRGGLGRVAWLEDSGLEIKKGRWRIKWKDQRKLSGSNSTTS